MSEPTPADFTQTVVGSATTSRSRLASNSNSESIEGRFPPGTLLNGRYRIIALLGKGGMGEVYRATDLTLGQSVALKFLPALAGSDPRWLERFHSEVRIARQVSHPNVCRVYDIGEAEDLPFLSMEYVDGEDLTSLIRRIGRLPSDKAVEIARKICAGLAAAHAKGIIHRDLKPHNIMLDRHGEVLICDFGLAAVASELHTTEIRQGTPAYMAPEQLKGTEVSTASDIYSLGLVLYEIFTGKRAYSATSINALLNQQEAMSLTSMSSHAGDIDPAVEAIIRRCLNPDSALRPANALSVAAALPGGDALAAALAAGQTPSPEMVAASRSAGLPTRYSIPLLAFCLIFLLALPFIRGRVETLNYSPIDIPRAALETRARDFAAQFGYPAKPIDWHSEFEARGAMVRWLADRPGRDWSTYFARESPLAFLYRQSPVQLPPMPDGLIEWNKPPLEQSNSLRLQLDSGGRIIYFEAVPPQSPNASPFSFESSALFAAIRLDQNLFRATTPFRTPLTAHDELFAFEGPHPSIPNASLKLQYALHKGRLTSLYFFYPWSTAITDSIKAQTSADYFNNYFSIIALATFLFFSITLSRRNWLANRADRRGAQRLFIFRFATGLASWLLVAHFVPDGIMINFVSLWLALSLLSALILWVLYIALEPALRQRWPQSIVTWNRVLSGRILDTQVGAHSLMGVAMGISIVIAFMLKSWFNFERIGRIGATWVSVDSPGRWLSLILDLANGAMVTGFITFFVIFGLRTLLRRDVFTMLGGTIFLCLINSDLWQSTNPLLDIGVYALISFAIILGLMRFGMLTTLVAVFVANTLGRTTLTTDLSAWFMPYSITTLLFLAALAVFSFWLSLGGQSLVGEDPK